MDPFTLWLILTIVASISITGSVVGYVVWNEYDKHKKINAKVSDQAVIEIAQGNQGKVDVSLLCQQTGLTAKEAKMKLKYLAKSKVLARDWKGFLTGSETYILPTHQYDFFGKFISAKGGIMTRLEAVFNGNTENPIALPATTTNKDAKIISLALDNQGITTASAVCVKLNISIEEAQKRLEDLRQRQIFMTEVGQNGGLLYRLLDA